jgi:hypothetical protein
MMRVAFCEPVVDAAVSTISAACDCTLHPTVTVDSLRPQYVQTILPLFITVSTIASSMCYVTLTHMI